MDQLTTASTYNSGIYEYKVAKNGDFGTAIGYDFTLELRGEYINSTIQYTYSTAKASSEYEEAAFGSVEVDAPMQEFLMPYDRTHDLTSSLYTKLPYGITAGFTYFYQSGVPYTPYIYNASGEKPYEDVLNKNTETTDPFQDRNSSKSIVGLENLTPFLSYPAALSINPATLSNAFEGMHPRFKQTPPTSSFSTNKTFFP